MVYREVAVDVQSVVLAFNQESQFRSLVVALTQTLPDETLTVVSVQSVDRIELEKKQQGYHHNGDQTARRPYAYCSISSR